jgi:hypothetical protein
MLVPLSRSVASVRLDSMRPLQVSTDEFRALADGVSTLATDFLAGLDERPTVSATSAIDTAAFDLPLPEEGVGEAVLRDLEAARRRGAAFRTCSGPVSRSGRWRISTRRC